MRGLSGGYEGLTAQPPHLETPINTGILGDYEGVWGRNTNSVVTARTHPLSIGKQLFLIISSDFVGCLRNIL